MTSKKRPDNKKQTTQSKSKETKTFPVIALGASAGGLKPLKKFFAKVPEDTGMAFFIVTHLSPDQPSLLPELIQKETNIPVTSARNGEVIEPNHVYIIPHKKDIEVSKQKIKLSEQKSRKTPLPIDIFLHSLAINWGNQAVGIILSGTGTDGSKGIREIKAYEGLVLVQSEKTAEHTGMPRSAISSGAVDIVLAPEEMPEMIVRYFNNSSDIVAEENHEPYKQTPEQEAWLNKIFSILNNQTHYDFTPYKTNTVQRRINRRMALRKTDTYKEYINYLNENPDEVEALFKELLIGVTSFFRDRESFEILETKGLSRIFKQMPDHSDFRVWVPACSTGEEIYSLAILLHEYLEKSNKRLNLYLFGTDINQQSIEKARAGVYPASIAADVGEERLKKYFTKKGDYFHIKEEIREKVVFSIQNVLKDPPFSRLNLLSCRNLLIYFDAETQKKLLPLFHYALNPNGILMLGSSETTGGFTRLFEPLDKKWKIFEKKEVPEGLKTRVDFPNEPSFQPSPEHRPAQKKQPNKEDFLRITQDAILNQFSPAAVLVDSDGNILHVKGRLGKYLEQPGGPPSLNILDQAREGLYINLSSAFRKAKEQNKTITRKRIMVKTNGNTQTLDLHVAPQNKADDINKQYLIVFEENDQPTPSSETDSALKTDKNYDAPKVAELEDELKINKENYQATLLGLEGANEKLKITNEELQSSNEELQSTNEELESSKEELQSLNEELQTVNSELQNKMEELSSARNDMYNLLNSRQIATIFVDNGLCIQRFTPESTKIVNLIQSDLGRPLEHVLTNLTYEGMIDDLHNVLQNLTPVEVEVQSKTGHWYSMRIIPYRTTDNRIDGAVLTFISIDEQKEVQEKLKKAMKEKDEAHVLLREAFDMNTEALLVTDKKGNMLIANKSFTNLMEINQQKIKEKNVSDLNKTLPESANLIEYINNAVEKGEDFSTNSFQLNKPDDSSNYTIHGRAVLNDRHNVYKILLTFKKERSEKK